MFWKIFFALLILIPILNITRFRPLPVVVAMPGLFFKNSIVSAIMGSIYGWALSLLLYTFCHSMHWYLFVPIYLLGLYNAIVYLANPSDNEMELMISTSSFMKVMNY